MFAGPNNVAYGAAKADQAHQVRLLAAELGEYGIRVNGVNPDGVVRGSGIFAKGWGAHRAAVYGVAGGGARRVLRAADAAQAGGAARARGGRRVRARRRGAVATPPGCTSRSTPASPPRSCDDATGGRSPRVDLGASSGRVIVGAVERRRLALEEVHRFPNRPVAERRRAALGHRCACTAEVLTGLRAAARAGARWSSIGIDSWAVDYGLLDAPARCSATPSTTATPAPTPRSSAVHARRPAAELYAAHRPPAPAVQHPLPARGRARRPRWIAARARCC